MMRMKRLFLILAAILVLGLVLFLAYRMFGNRQPDPVPTQPTNFPIASSTSDGLPSIPLMLRNGSTISVNDFTKSSLTVTDNQDPTILYLNGDPGLCQAGVSCPEGAGRGFDISFDSEASLFTVTLLKEPLGELRREAEQQLKGILGITETQMCALNYSVGTLGFVSETYGGRELGFSFCPGAVPLP